MDGSGATLSGKDVPSATVWGRFATVNRPHYFRISFHLDVKLWSGRGHGCPADGAGTRMKFWYWLGGIVLSVIVVGVAAVMITNFYWPRLQDNTTASAASAMGSIYGAGVGLLSAVASAAAAIAAFMAARKSDETAQRAGEALGLAMQPKLTAHIQRISHNPGSADAKNLVHLEVKNLSHWPASDVKIFPSNRRLLPLAEIDYLPAATQPNYTIAAKPHIVTVDLTNKAVASRTDLGNLLVVEFSDERHILRWRQTIKHTGSLESEVELLK